MIYFPVHTTHHPKAHSPLISIGANGQVQISVTQGQIALQNAAIIVLLIAVFVLLDRSGVVAQVASLSASSIPAVFLLGFAASLSTCAALAGGLLMSQPKTAQAHSAFHIGRISAYVIGGGLLGVLGAAVQINTQITALIVIIVCILMIISGLQVLNVGWANQCKLLIPRPVRELLNRDQNPAYVTSFLSGVVTFLLPCSLTLIAQGIALNSGNFIGGSLVMFSFALGTLPVLLTISISSWRFSLNPQFSLRFQHITAIVVIILAAYSINSNLNILGLPSLSDVQQTDRAEALPQVINGKQVINMSATPNGYSPSYFRVRAGIPVEWQINGSSIPSCSSTIQANGLLGKAEIISSGPNLLTFIAPTPGSYKFSCAMGMFSGIIEAV